MRTLLFILLPASVACSLALAADTPKPQGTARQDPVQNIDDPMNVLNEQAHRLATKKEKPKREQSTGIKVATDPDAGDDEAQWQALVAAMIAKADFVPDARFQRFRHFREPMPTKISGWHASILAMEPNASGLMVTLAVTPKLTDGLWTSDKTIETYLLSERGVQHLGTFAPAHHGIVTCN